MKIFIAVLLSGFLCVAGCASQKHIPEDCQPKLSHQLQSQILRSGAEIQFNIIVTVEDTIGIRTNFPMLKLVNNKIALGHLTTDEIFSLCQNEKVKYIETPKTLYPKK